MAYANGYEYRRKVTVDNTQVSGTSDLVDFPVLFSETNADLADTANGGHVESSSGDDIRFESLSGTQYDHEIDKYDNVNGELIAHVRVPTVASGSDTEFYIYYGNVDVSTPEENPAGVWTNHLNVYHINQLTGIGENHRVVPSDTIDGAVVETISFYGSYTKPVVVPFIATFNGSQAIAARAKNVTSTGCDVFMKEPDDGTHAAEELWVLVMEAGTHLLPDGTRIEANTVDTSSTHSSGQAFGGPTVSFETNYFGAAPALLHGLQTNNNADFADTVAHSITFDDFQVQQEVGASGSATQTETIGWIAIQSGVEGAWYETGSGADGMNDGVDDTPHTITFNKFYADDGGHYGEPLSMVKGQTANGNDGYWSRGAYSPASLNNTDFKVYAEEDQVGDLEQGHTDESFGYWIMERWSYELFSDRGIEDSTSNTVGLHPVRETTSAIISGQIHEAISLSTNGRMRMPDDALSGVGDVSISFWMRGSGTGAECYFSKIDTGANDLIIIRHSSADDFVVYIGGTKVCGINFPTDPRDGAWHLITAVYAANGTSYLQVDNNTPATQSTSGGVTSLTTEPTEIGRDSRGQAEYTGDIEEFRIQTRTITGDWVDTTYANQSSPSTFYSVGTEEVPGQSYPEAEADTNATAKKEAIADASADAEADITCSGSVQPAGHAHTDSEADVTSSAMKEALAIAALEGGSETFVSAEAEVSSGAEVTVSGLVQPADSPELDAGSDVSATPEDVVYTRIQKRYLWKAYDNLGYVATWGDVKEDPGFRQQINTAGSEMTVTLSRPADDFGEDFDVKFGVRVDIVVADSDAPQGIKLFSGYISKYEPDYNTDDVTVTLLGYGGQMSQYMIESDETLSQEQANQNSVVEWYTYFYDGTGENRGRIAEHTFTVGSTDIDLSRIKYQLRGQDTPNGFASGYGKDVTVGVYDNEADARSQNTDNALATATREIRSNELEVYDFSFETPPVLSASTLYYLGVSMEDFGVSLYPEADPQEGEIVAIGTDGTNPYSGGTFYYYDSDTATWVDTNEDPWFEIYSSTTTTTVPFNSYEPAQILREILDNFNFRGGIVTYDANSIDDTGTTVTYEFNTNTVREGVDKVLELCPPDWYYHIDQSTNIVHLHKKADTVDHTFTIGRDIRMLRITKSTEDIVNVLYFSGGGDPPLFKKYSIQSSIDTYGVHAEKKKDGRVTLESTADIMANKAMQGSPVIRVIVEVSDGSLNRTGYDIEAVKPGDIVQITNTGTGKTSKFGTAEYDVSPYDYDISDISTIQFQATSVRYSPDSIKLSLSTVPPDINKRIEDIVRNLSDIQHNDNPSSPTT